MADVLTRFDPLLASDGPAAVTLRQWLKPVGDQVVFPPTYANPRRGDPPVYNIDPVAPGEEAERICTIDSIPSQANRMEPMLGTVADGRLVPRVIITVEKTGDRIDLLEAGHRAADAIVRFSSLGDTIEEAFAARLKNDSLPLARLAPTSLVFGAWDSRASGAKIPRLLNSIIRAHDARPLRRSAQYVPAIPDYVEAGVSDAAVKSLSEHGMAAVPATHQLGGVIARGGIARTASLNLSSLRALSTPDPNEALTLRRYVLGLALVALTYFDGRTLDLRQGCQLVADPDRAMERSLIYADGREKAFPITHTEAIEYAVATAEAFGVGGPLEGSFEPELAHKTAKDSKKKKGGDG
jgi:CRISPR-associated protein Csb1